MEGIEIIVVEWVSDPELAQRHAEITEAYHDTIDATRIKSQRDRERIAGLEQEKEELHSKLEDIEMLYRQLLDEFATQFACANKAFEQFMETHRLPDDCEVECENEIRQLEEDLEEDDEDDRFAPF